MVRAQKVLSSHGAGWNYLARVYRPRAEVLNATWTRPEMRPAN